MHLRRDFYESYSKTVRLDPKLENLMKPWSRRGIPFDHNEFSRQGVPIGLFQEGLGKELKSAKHVAPVIVIACSHDKTEMAIRRAVLCCARHQGIPRLVARSTVENISAFNKP